jgi:hypothetical protein
MVLRPEDKKLQALDQKKLRFLLSEACFFVWKDRASPPPPDIVEAVMAGADRFFRPVREIVLYPAITQSGRIVRESGYDEETECYFDLPGLGEATGAEEALGVLGDVFADFPFRGEADRANLYAMLLTFVMRRGIGGPVPAFIAQAPVQGTGKSKLVTAALSILMGKEVVSSFLPRDEAEVQKTLGGMIMAGRPYFFFDNLKCRMASSFLEGTITSRYIDFRILGSNAIFTAENNFVFVFTSNNPQIEKDLVRRMVPVNLDADREHPEDVRGRRFRHPDIEGHVLRERPRILAALLSLATRGGPWDGPVMGSFEAWSRAVGGALAAAGVPGFLGNLGEFSAAADDQEAALAAFVNLWADAFGENPACVRDLEAFADEAGLVGEAAKNKAWLLSRIIGKNLNRVVAGYKITRYSVTCGRIRYCLKIHTPNSHPAPQGFLDAWKP